MSTDKAAHEAERFRQARILVADDQEGMVALIRRVVANAFQCHITSVETGDQALAALEIGTYDVFLTDMRMPGVHGLELIEKALAADGDMNVLVMTGYPEDFPYVEVAQRGATDFLNKPFRQEELKGKLIRVLRERQLRHDLLVAHRKYRSLFDLSMDGNLLIGLDDSIIQDANEAFYTLLGAGRDELLGADFRDLIAGPDRDRFEQWMPLCERSGKGTIGDLQLRHPTGTFLHFDVTVTMVRAGDEAVAFLAFRNITEKRETDRNLADAAQKDGLTGLYNKRSFSNRIEWAVASAAETGAPLALFMVDLDNFKQCNDTHGHPIGDGLLKSVGEVIKNSIRITAYDEGFRCGGDEFAVLLHQFRPGGTAAVARRMHESFDQIERYGTTMSIGVAEFKAGMTPADLVAAADKALYGAKHQGKNVTCFAP